MAKVSKVADIVIPIPPALQQTEAGAVTEGVAYSLTLPLVATDPIIIRHPDGSTLTMRPRELYYRDEHRELDPIVDSAPVSVATGTHHARYERLYPLSDDTYATEPERIKHYTSLYRPPRAPAAYLMGHIEFGLSWAVEVRNHAGEIVPLPAGEAESLTVGPFTFLQPHADDLSFSEKEPERRIQGRYEVVDTGEGQVLFAWFDAAWLLSEDRRYPVTVDPTVTTTAYKKNTLYYSYSRHIVRLSDGTLVAGITPGNPGPCAYISRDGGVTWVAPASGAALPDPNGDIVDVREGSLAVAPDDSVIFAFAGGNAWDQDIYGGLFVARGVLNAERTDITWSIIKVKENSSYNSYDEDVSVVVAQYGSELKVLVSCSWFDLVDDFILGIYRVTVSSTGELSASTYPREIYTDYYAAGGSDYGSYYNFGPAAAVDSTGKLHMAVRLAGSSGAQNMIQYYTAPFSNGAWTFPLQTNERVGGITSPEYPNTARGGILSLAIDGQDRPIVAYKRADTNKIVVFRRSTDGVWQELTGVPDAIPTSLGVTCRENDVMLWYTDGTGLKRSMWKEATGTWSAPVTVDSDATACDVSVLNDNTAPGSYALYLVGSASPYTVKSATFLYNQPPQEPTIIAPSVFDATDGLTLTIHHNDPDPGDVASGVYLKVGNQWWNGSALVATKPASPLPGDSMDVQLHIGGIWTAGQTYQLYAATVDASGVEGPLNSVATVVKASVKPVATVTSPASGAVIPYSYLEVKATQTVASGVAPASYTVTVYDEIGAVLHSATYESSGALYARLDYEVPNGLSGQVGVTPTDSDGLSGDEVRVPFTVQYTPPVVPTITATPGELGGYVGISVQNGTPVDPQPHVAYNDVYRRPLGSTTWTRIATNVPPDTAYLDYQVASNQTYEYMVKAVGENGTVSSSNTVTATATIPYGLWLHDPLDTTTAHFFEYYEANLQDNPKHSAGQFMFAGRTYPVTQFSAKAMERSVKFRLALPKDTDDLAALENLFYRRTTLCLRDARGRKLYGTIKELPITDEKWGATADIEFTVVDYKEGV